MSETTGKEARGMTEQPEQTILPGAVIDKNTPIGMEYVMAEAGLPGETWRLTERDGDYLTFTNPQSYVFSCTMQQWQTEPQFGAAVTSVTGPGYKALCPDGHPMTGAAGDKVMAALRAVARWHMSGRFAPLGDEWAAMRRKTHAETVTAINDAIEAVGEALRK